MDIWMDPIFDLELRPDVDVDMVLVMKCRTCMTDHSTAAERQADYDDDKAIRVPTDPEDKALIATFDSHRLDLNDLISESRNHWRHNHQDASDGPCSCICHRMPGVKHIMACCKFPPMAEPPGADDDDDVILTPQPGMEIQVVDDIGS